MSLFLCCPSLCYSPWAGGYPHSGIQTSSIKNRNSKKTRQSLKSKIGSSENIISRYNRESEISAETKPGHSFLNKRYVSRKAFDFPERLQDTDSQARNRCCCKRGVKQVSDVAVLFLKNAKRTIVRGQFIDIKRNKGDQGNAGYREGDAAGQSKKQTGFAFPQI